MSFVLLKVDNDSLSHVIFINIGLENAPAIIFIDEIDAIATKRFDAQTGGEFSYISLFDNFFSLN
jgi:hypothetical protein